MTSAYCSDLYAYTRRVSREVMVGNVGVGGSNPIRIQSMLTSDTRDTASCVKEALELAKAGCEIIRLTAQTKAYAANLQNIVRELRAAHCDVPLVADIHFKPDAAMEAAKWVEKIRINPGNFVDKKRFESHDYTDMEYEEELERLRTAFTPLVLFCKEHGRAMRIGSNHGSLSDRILNRYGDTPEGMVESALEYARVAHDLGYHQLVFSMKASNVKVMITAYRLLTARLNEAGEGWNYPIHLGVTEAGAAEDGRIKSAVGIGALLLDGIGDTLRVSLTEDAIHEIPVAQALATPFQPDNKLNETPQQHPLPTPSYDPLRYKKRLSGLSMSAGVRYGWNEPVRVVLPAESCRALASQRSELGDMIPEIAFEDLDIVQIDPRDTSSVQSLSQLTEPTMVTVADGVGMSVPTAFRYLASVIEERHPILLKDTLHPQTLSQDAALQAAANIGSLLCDGIGNAVFIRTEADPKRAARLSYDILQATAVRLSRTEYVSCPSCGRTLYNIQEATVRIRRATGHLKGVKIAVMGCIVNGPGEMSDADFGYVGGAPGKINLYVGHTPVKQNIPQEEAVDRLIDLIREHGRWIAPPTGPTEG